jgi:hypothetical protein
MVTPSFRIGATSDRFWNLTEFVHFLAQHQGQAIELGLDPEAICLDSLGVYQLLDAFDFESVRIVTHNPLAAHNRYSIEKLRADIWFSMKPLLSPDLHTWNKQKIFYALFGRPTAARLGLAGYLFSYHAQLTHLHFSTPTNTDNLVQFELDKLLEFRIASVVEAATIIGQLPILLSSADLYTANHGYYYHDPLTQHYRDILVDVVVESHVKGRTFFPTEKTARPMWLKKPFIMFASRDYLDYLHQMGFKTFCSYWSEDYDGYEGRERFLRIINLIDHIAQLPQQELVDMYLDMQPILEHNYQLLLNQRYFSEITQIT